MVATTGLDEQSDVRGRTTELQLETEEEVRTRQEHEMDYSRCESCHGNNRD